MNAVHRIKLETELTADKAAKASLLMWSESKNYFERGDSVIDVYPMKDCPEPLTAISGQCGMVMWNLSELRYELVYVEDP